MLVYTRPFSRRVPALGHFVMVALGLLGMPTKQLSGQAVHRRTPVLVVMLDSLPEAGARAMIERHARGDHREVVLLSTQGSTARQLSAAIFTLLTARAATGDSVTRDMRVRVPFTEGPRAWIETTERHAERVIRRLHSAPLHYEPAYGFVRTARITVPSDALAGRLRPRQ